MQNNSEKDQDDWNETGGSSGEAAEQQRVPIGEPVSVSEAENENALEDRMHGQEDQPGMPAPDDQEWSPGSSAADE